MTETSEPNGQLKVTAAGRSWILERPADLESLWQSMDEDDPKAEEHIPYWVELWPATLALCGWLARQELAGHRCLDLGCGLGLSALVAANLGARVVGMDYEHGALHFAARNARINSVPSPLWVRMDWNKPGLAPASFDRIWGGDIFYEQRFSNPWKIFCCAAWLRAARSGSAIPNGPCRARCGPGSPAGAGGSGIRAGKWSPLTRLA